MPEPTPDNTTLITTPRFVIVIDDPNRLDVEIGASSLEREFSVGWLWNSPDGPRPLHGPAAELGERTASPSPASPWPDGLEFRLEADYVVFLEPERQVKESALKELLSDPRSDSQSREDWASVRAVANSADSLRAELGVVADLVSVIVPTYGRADVLREAIESVRAQTYANWELLVVDDNPPNSAARRDTESLLRSYADDSRIRYLRHSRPRNGSAARNTGLLASRGEYICFLDDDDVYLPNKLQASVQALRAATSPVEAVYGGYLGWNSEQDDPSRYHDGDLTLELLTLRYDQHYLHTNTPLYRRRALLAIMGFDESFRRHQDVEMHLRFLERFRLEAVRESMVRFRPSEQSTGGLDGPGLFAVKQKFLRRFRSTIERFPPDVRNEIYEAHWRDVKHRFGGAEEFARYCASLDPEHPINGFFHDLWRTIGELRREIAAAKAEQRRLTFRDELWWASTRNLRLPPLGVADLLEIATQPLTAAMVSDLLAAPTPSDQQALASKQGKLSLVLCEFRELLKNQESTALAERHAQVQSALRPAIDRAVHLASGWEWERDGFSSSDLEQARETQNALQLLGQETLVGSQGEPAARSVSPANPAGTPGTLLFAAMTRAGQPASIGRYIAPHIKRKCATRYLVLPDGSPAVLLGLPGFRIWSWLGRKPRSWIDLCDLKGQRIALPSDGSLVTQQLTNPTIGLGQVTGIVVRYRDTKGPVVRCHGSSSKEGLSAEPDAELRPSGEPRIVMFREPLTSSQPELWLGFRTVTPNDRPGVVEVSGLLVQV